MPVLALAPCPSPAPQGGDLMTLLIKKEILPENVAKFYLAQVGGQEGAQHGSARRCGRWWAAEAVRAGGWVYGWWARGTSACLPKVTFRFPPPPRTGISRGSSLLP